jgi:hypothetical protein
MYSMDPKMDVYIHQTELQKASTVWRQATGLRGPKFVKFVKFTGCSDGGTKKDQHETDAAYLRTYRDAQNTTWRYRSNLTCLPWNFVQTDWKTVDETSSSHWIPSASAKRPRYSGQVFNVAFVLETIK